MKRAKFLRWSFIFALALVALSATTSLVVYGALRWAVTSGILAEAATKAIKDQTGADVTIGRVDVGFLSGLSIKDISVLLPTAGSPESEGDPAPSQKSPDPDLQIREVRFKYRLWGLALGMVRVDELLLDGVSIRLWQNGDGNTFSGVTRFRARRFPSETKPPETEATSLSRPSEFVESMLPFGPLPLRLSVGKVGVEKLDVVWNDSHTSRSGKIMGASLIAGGVWWGTKGELTLDLKVDGVSGLLQTTKSLNWATLILLDLEERSLELAKSDFTVPNLVAWKFKGAASLPEDSFSNLDFSISLQDLWARLDEVNEILTSFMPDARIAGTVGVSTIAMSGKWRDGQIQPTAVAGAASIDEVAFAHPVGRLMPTTAELKLASHQGDNGLELSINSSLNSEGASTEAPQKGGRKLGIVLGPITTAVQGRFLWNEMRPSFAKASLNLPKIVVLEGSNLVAETSFNAEAEANVADATGSGSGKVSAKFGDGLGHLDAEVSCGAKCGEASGKIDISIPELEMLRKMMAGLPEALAPRDVIPRVLSGVLRVNGQAQRTAAGIISGDVQVAATNYSVEMPRPSLVLLRGNTTLQAAAGESSHSIKFKHTSGRVSAKLGERTVSLGSSSAEFLASGNTGILAPASGILDELDTNVTSRVVASKLDAPDFLAKTIESITFDLSGKLSRIGDVSVRKLELNVPDLGLEVSAGASARFQRNPEENTLKASDFRGSAKVRIGQNAAALTGGKLQFSGSAAADVVASSGSGDRIRLDGSLSFDRFSLTIPAAKEGDIPALVVSDLRGRIPIGTEVEPKRDASRPAPKKDEDDLIAAAQEYEQRRNAVDRDRTESGSRYFKELNYGDVRPVIGASDFIRLARLQTSGIEATEISVDAEVNASGLAVPHFSLRTLDGKVVGSAFVDVSAKGLQPVAKRVRSSVHWSQLNTRKLVSRFRHLRKRAQTWNPLSNPNFDGTLNVVYDLAAGDLNGGLEITTIGEEQLRMMLYYIDPMEKNPTLRQIQRALTVGEARRVSVPIKNGMLGLEVDVRLLKVPIPTPKLSRIPVGQILENYTKQSKEDAPVAEDQG